MATGQLANQIFTAMAIEKHNETVDPQVLVDRSFSLAEAFDKRLQTFLEPSKIKLAKSMDEVEG